MFGQQCWARETPQGTRADRKRVKRIDKRAGKHGESDRWARVLAHAGRVPEGVRQTLVADRECDIFEVLLRCAENGNDWVIRAAQPRSTTSTAGDVFEAAAQAPVRGSFTVKRRSRPGVSARKAKVAVRAVATEIMAPRDFPGGRAPQAATIVEVRELEPPGDVDPLYWVLLTSWPCEAFAQARRVVGVYACRWLIEEYHKALKTGTHIEESQLSSAGRIEALLAIHAVVAAGPAPGQAAGQYASRRAGRARSHFSRGPGHTRAAIRTPGKAPGQCRHHARHRTHGRLSRTKTRRTARLAQHLARLAKTQAHD